MVPSGIPVTGQSWHITIALFSWAVGAILMSCSMAVVLHRPSPIRHHLFISHFNRVSPCKSSLYASKRKDRSRKGNRKSDISESDEEEDISEGISDADLEVVFAAFQEKLKESEDFLHGKISRIALHRATPSLLESITVEIPGEKTERKLEHVASIMSKGNYELHVLPLSPAHLDPVFVSLSTKLVDYKVTMMQDRVSVTIPPMTELMARQARNIVKETSNEAKCRIRTHRQNTIKKLKKMQDRMSDDMFHRQQKEVEKLVKEAEQKVDKISNEALKNLK